MSVTTIDIPNDQIGALAASLRARRQEVEDDLERRGEGSPLTNEIEALLGQIDESSGGSRQELTGSHPVLWAAAYDVLCGTAERFAAQCNEIWRDLAALREARERLAELDAQLGVLEKLGPPPGGSD